MYLTPKDIATELQVSRSRAYEIARECKRIVAGRTIRVSRASFEAWKRNHEEPPCVNLSTSAARSGGVVFGTLPAVDTSRFRPGVASAERPVSGGKNWNASPSRQPIKPRTRPLSERLSTTESRSDETQDEQREPSAC